MLLPDLDYNYLLPRSLLPSPLRDEGAFSLPLNCRRAGLSFATMKCQCWDRASAFLTPRLPAARWHHWLRFHSSAPDATAMTNFHLLLLNPPPSTVGTLPRCAAKPQLNRTAIFLLSPIPCQKAMPRRASPGLQLVAEFGTFHSGASMKQAENLLPRGQLPGIALCSVGVLGRGVGQQGDTARPSTDYASTRDQFGRQLSTSPIQLPACQGVCCHPPPQFLCLKRL